MKGGGSENAEAAEGATDDALPAMDLATFILSLSHSAHVDFGDAVGPTGEATSPNLGLARQSIDLLVLLQEKTRGNLTGEEESLLEQTLYELRRRFAEASAKRAS